MLHQNAHRSSSELSVATASTMASPVSVMLKTISVFSGAYVFQNGVILSFCGLLFGVSDLTKLRKEPAKDASKTGF